MLTSLPAMTSAERSLSQIANPPTFPTRRVSISQALPSRASTARSRMVRVAGLSTLMIASSQRGTTLRCSTRTKHTMLHLSNRTTVAASRAARTTKLASMAVVHLASAPVEATQAIIIGHNSSSRSTAVHRGPHQAIVGSPMSKSSHSYSSNATARSQLDSTQVHSQPRPSRQPSPQGTVEHQPSRRAAEA